MRQKANKLLQLTRHDILILELFHKHISAQAICACTSLAPADSNKLPTGVAVAGVFEIVVVAAYLVSGMPRHLKWTRNTSVMRE